MITTNEFYSDKVTAVPINGVIRKASKTIDTAALVQMIKAKEEKGFNTLYDNYSSSLYGILLKIVRHNDVADDLLQDTFVKIWQHIDKFDAAKGTLFTWMLNIARNLAIDHQRSSSYRMQLQMISIDVPFFREPNTNTTTSYINEGEFKDFQKKALQLEPKYAEVIDLIFFYGWTQEQTAQLLKLPLGTVKTRARKGLSILKVLYQH